MNLYNLLGYPLFFVAALEILLGFILLKQNTRNSPVNKAVAAFSFASAGYSLFTGIIHIRTDLGMPIDFAARANWVGWLSIPAALQSIFYMRDEQSRKARLVGLVLYPFWTLTLVLSLFTELVEPAGYSLNPPVNHTGPLENPARAFGAFQILWVMYEVYQLRRHSTGTRRAQVNHFFYGTIIFGGGSAFIAGFLQLFGGFGLDPGLGAYFSFPWVVLTFYAISRYHLFDISLIISRALTVLLLSLSVAVLHIGLFRLFAPAMGSSLAILFSLFLIGTVFFGTHLSREVQWRIQSFILRDRYDYQRLLKESIRASITILDLDELLHHLVNSMNRSLKAESIGLFLKGRDGEYALRVGNSLWGGGKAGIPPVPAAAGAWMLRTGRIVTRQELDETLAPSDFKMVNEYMQNLDAQLIIPLLHKEDLLGYVTLGSKGGGKPYIQSDIDLLELLAGQASIAIENAQLFEEVRRAKDSMRESEAKFRTLAETAAMGIFIHQGGNLLYANRASEVIGGYTVEEYLTMNFMSLVHPDFIEQVKSRAQDRLGGDKAVPSQYEFKILRKNREERWVLMTAGVSEFEGKPAVIGTLIDITERKQAEEERERYFQQLQEATKSLRESEEKFRTLAETTTAAIFIHQGQKLVYANTAGEIMSGYTREELLREDFWTLIHPDYQELTKERGQSRLRGERIPKEYEFKFITKSGEERWSATTAGVIEYGGEPAIIATLFDITEWKRAEEAKVKFYEESVRQYQERIDEEKRHGVEKEKILMDLHDGIGGITTNISILSELALKARNREDTTRLLSTISRLSKEGIAEIRSFMHSLDSTELNWRTLAAELRSQGSGMVETHNIAFSIQADVNDMQEQPGSLTWLNVFKIYKEALTNVVKHSKATEVAVAFDVGREAIRLTVRDNGVGLEGETSGGRGLSHMKMRARDIGGSVTVFNGQGATVHLEIPVPLKYPAGGMEIP